MARTEREVYRDFSCADSPFVRLSGNTNIENDNVPSGVCKRCTGYGTIRYQSAFGDVEYAECNRCHSTGKEPPQLQGKLRTWFGQLFKRRIQ